MRSVLKIYKRNDTVWEEYEDVEGQVNSAKMSGVVAKEQGDCWLCGGSEW